MSASSSSSSSTAPATGSSTMPSSSIYSRDISSKHRAITIFADVKSFIDSIIDPHCVLWDAFMKTFIMTMFQHEKEMFLLDI